MDKEIERIKTTQEDISGNTKKMDNVVDNTECVQSDKAVDVKDNSIQGENTVESSKAIDKDTERENKEAKHPVSNNNTSDKGDNAEAKPKRNGMDNLVDMRTMTAERQREIASMGGKASQAKAKERKRARELMQTILSATMSEQQVNKVLGKDKDLIDGDASVYSVMLTKMALQACKGDSKAATFVRDTAGDKPDENMNVATVFTEGDKALMEKLSKRLGMGEN